MGRIIIYGHFCSGNIGNDGTLEAALHHLKKHRPTADFICVSTGYYETSRRFGIETRSMSSGNGNDQIRSDGDSSRLRRISLRVKDELRFWAENPRWFQPGDRFIIVGTGAVDDMGVRYPWHAPYALYKWCKTAKLGGAEVIFLSVGVGPIRNPLSRSFMLRALRMADYRSYRDTAAFNYLQSVGHDTSGDLSYPDLVFSLPKASLPLIRGSSSPPLVVGLGLINYSGWRPESNDGEQVYQQYISKLKHFMAWMLREGFIVRLLFGDVADARPVEDLTEFVNKQGESQWRERFIVEDIPDINELFYQIAQTDIVVASRFHNVLCSLMLERPVISLGYHEKNDRLMEEMGLGDYCQHIEHFSTERLIEQFNACILEADQIVHQIHARLDNYRYLLDDQYEMLLESA